MNKNIHEWLTDPLIKNLDEKDRDLFARALTYCKTDRELIQEKRIIKRIGDSQKRTRQYHRKLKRLKDEGYKWCVTYFPSYLGSPKYFKTLRSAKRYAESCWGEVWLDPIEGKTGGTYWRNKAAGKYRCTKLSDYVFIPKASTIFKSVEFKWLCYLLAVIFAWVLLWLLALAFTS